MHRPKYYAEIMLEFQSYEQFLCRVSDVYSLEDDIPPDARERLKNCHIYLLGKRPRLSIDPDSIAVDDAALRFRVEYRSQGRVNGVEVVWPRELLLPNESAFTASQYPHRELLSYGADGKFLGTTLLANYAQLIPGLPPEARDLEVLYVGKGLSDTAHDRIRKHATLQKILAEIHSNDPDAEVFALVYSFQYRKPLLILNVTPEISGAPARQRAERALAFKPSLNEQIELVEATIISYFRTDTYNTQYIEFPHRRQQILAPVYEADFAAILCELDNETLGRLRLFSRLVPPQSRHEIIVDFRRAEGRPSIWEVAESLSEQSDR